MFRVKIANTLNIIYTEQNMGPPLHGRQFWTCIHIINFYEIFKFESHSTQTGYAELY